MTFSEIEDSILVSSFDIAENFNNYSFAFGRLSDGYFYVLLRLPVSARRVLSFFSSPLLSVKINSIPSGAVLSFIS